MKRTITSLFLLFAAYLAAADSTVTADWTKVIATSRATASLQVVVNPLLRQGSPIHDQVFQALKDLGADYVRYVPWMPYPGLAVAELEPPRDGKTSWDFSAIDPMTLDFLHATSGHSVMLNFSTIPQWMFKTESPVKYPADPNAVVWDYSQGTELRDPSLKELGDYYARLVSWYTQGGFTDELGKRHDSPHHFKVDYWEVLNEPEFEHQTTPQQYTERYDAIVGAIRVANPQMKFVGMALAFPTHTPEYFEYFLNPKNHRSGIPLDMISYHFYASPPADQPYDSFAYTFFDQADGFLNGVRFMQSIRERLSPSTQTAANELGAILPDFYGEEKTGHPPTPIPNSYWNLCGAMYAYLYSHLAAFGVEVVNESQLVGYPTQFPSVTMLDWNTGRPNARYWVLKLLQQLGPGDKLVETKAASPFVYAQGFLKADGKRVLLLVNKRDVDVTLTIPGGKGAHESVVDQHTGFAPAPVQTLTGEQITLGGFAVALIALP